MLAVHLCGTLSIRAVELFNANRGCVGLALKPCCLPVPTHAYRKEEWRLGGHIIRAREVCSVGKWRGGQWIGPPRTTLAPRFHKWCHCLAEGTDVGVVGRKDRRTIQVQLNHFQNFFLFAEREHGVGGNQPPLSSSFDHTATQPKPGLQQPSQGPAATTASVNDD